MDGGGPAAGGSGGQATGGAGATFNVAGSAGAAGGVTLEPKNAQFLLYATERLEPQGEPTWNLVAQDVLQWFEGGPASVPQLLTDGALGFHEFSPDGRYLAFVDRVRHVPTHLHAVQLTNASVTGLAPVSEARYVGEVAWSPESRRLAWLEMPLESTPPVVKVLDTWTSAETDGDQSEWGDVSGGAAPVTVVSEAETDTIVFWLSESRLAFRDRRETLTIAEFADDGTHTVRKLDGAVGLDILRAAPGGDYALVRRSYQTFWLLDVQRQALVPLDQGDGMMNWEASVDFGLLGAWERLERGYFVRPLVGALAEPQLHWAEPLQHLTWGNVSARVALVNTDTGLGLVESRGGVVRGLVVETAARVGSEAFAPGDERFAYLEVPGPFLVGTLWVLDLGNGLEAVTPRHVANGVTSLSFTFTTRGDGIVFHAGDVLRYTRLTAEPEERSFATEGQFYSDPYWVDRLGAVAYLGQLSSGQRYVELQDVSGVRAPIRLAECNNGSSATCDPLWLAVQP